MTNLAWTDNCDGSGTVTGVDGALTGGNCGGTITRTWTYTDNCGNVGTATQTITVNDTQAPVFAASPGDVTVSCVGDVPAMTNLAWTDNCDGSGTVTGVDGALTGGNCGGTITRTWTYTDNCGNVGTATQTITVNDTQAPVFAAAPADVTVSCIGDVPAMTNLSWTDNCDGAGIATGTDGALTGGNCGGTITRTWTYTDNCGNVGTATQTITVNDTQAPVFAAAPADLTVSCIGDVPAMTNLSWTDNCDGAGIVTGTDGPLTGGNCGGTITRTWTYTDNCGNVGTATQTITVDDNVDPTASNPPTLNIASGSAPAPDITVVTDEADNCTINPVVAFVADSTDGLNCPETIYRTYSVTDDCNNQIIVTQIIIVGGGTVPIPTLSVNGPLCEGEDAVFTITGQADAIVTYNVGPGPQTTTLTGGVSTITITSSNTNVVMNLTNISDGSCSTVLNISDSVIVNPLVTPTFTQLGPYCVTGTVDALPVVSLEGITGTWSPDPVDNSAAGTFTSIFTPTVGQCANTAQMDILINAAPFIEAAATDSVICVGDSVELYISDISGGMLVETFTMTFGSAFSYTTSNTGLAGPYVAVVSGTYVGATGEIRDAYSLFQQGGVPITPLPGSPWQWNGAGASTQSVIPWGYNPAHVYNYFFNGGGPQTFSFTDSNYGDNSGSLTFEIYYLGSISWSTGSTDFTDIVYPPVGSNTYSVTVDYGGGCTATDDVTITVNAPTPATFNQVAPICSGDAFTLPAVSNEGYTGVWSPSIDNTTTTTYTFTPDPGQCADIATMTVTVNQPTTPTFTQVGAICSGDPIAALPTTSNEGITGTWSPAMDNTQTTTYTFTPDVGQCAGSATMTITVNQPSTPTFAQVGPYCSGDVIPALSTTSNEGITGTWSPSIDNTQTTTYTFTPTAGQCATTATITITINPPSIPSFNQVPAICEGENFTIPSTSLEGIIGAWSPVPNNTQTTTYTFTPNTGQCATTTTMTIDVNANPSPQFTVDSILGCAPLSVLFSSSNSGSLAWDFGDGNSANGQNASNTYQNPGCYYITLTVTENGCSNTITVVDQVCVVSPPVASFTANPNVFSIPGENINFFNSSSGADTYIWNFGDGGSSSETDPSHYFSNTEEGAVVTLTAISSAGCSDQTQLVLIMNEQEIFYVPNTFTPDGDNYNQMFLPIFTSGFDPFNYELLIFNRWGELVFESHDVNIGWDGTYSAKAFDAQDGVYTWKIIYKNPVNDERKIVVGHVTLMR
jgi:gliding motility-associated-like protein